MKTSKTRLWGMRFAIVLSVLICFFGGNTEFVAAQQLSAKQKQWYRYGIDYADSEASQCSTDSKAAATSTFDEAQFSQHLFVGVSSGDVAKEILAKYNIGGIFLMSSGSPGRVSEELKASIPGMQSAAKTPLLIATDQEYTYTVNSFGLADDKKATDLAGMSYDAVKAEGARFGTALSAAGVNMDFAPDTDLLSDGNDVIANNYRAISSNPDVVTQKAKAFAEGLAGTKVTPVIKHFPGHGHSSGDSHQTLPTTPPLAQLEQSDILPFKNLASESNMAIMIGHLNVPDLTNGKPASMSSEAYGYLRNKLQYRGLIITDELAGMVGAGSGSVGSKIADSLNAGADMALFNVDSMSAFESAYNDAKGATKNADDSQIIARKRFYGLNVSDQTPAQGTTPDSSSGSNANGCCAAISAVNLTGKDNTEKVLAYLLGKGLTLPQAAGVIGNFKIESFEDIRPNAQEIGKWPLGGFGIAQWTAGRRTGNALNLVDWLKKTNTIDLYVDGMPKLSDADNDRLLAAELDFFWAEEQDTEKASLEALQAITGNTAADAAEAARTFERVHERCSPTNGEAGCDVPKRMSYATDVFNKYADASALSGSNSTATGTANATKASASTGGQTCQLGNAPITSDFVFYTQWQPDSPWAGQPYGDGTYADSACGATATAMVVATWKDRNITPLETGTFTLSIGAQFQGSRLPEVFKHYDMQSEYIGTGDKFDEVMAALKDHKMVIVSASGTNPFTSAGHFIVLRGLSPDGQILMGDPNAGKPGSGLKREENNTRPWSIDELRAAAPGGFNSVNIITNPGKPV